MTTWNNDWRLEVHYKLEDDSISIVPYRLYDTPYLLLWIDQWKRCKKRNEEIYSWFINKSKNDLSELYERLKVILEVLRSQDTVDIPELHPTFEQSQFNEWHKIFEERCHEVHSNVNDNYMELNALIHTIESVSKVKSETLPYRAIVGVLGLQEALPLLPEYQLFSHHNESWGDLTMSYATTGKNWLEVAGTNDVEIIEEEGITNKTLIRQEFIAHYYYDTSHDLFKHLKQLDHLRFIYVWYMSLPLYLKEKVPIDNLSKLYYRSLFLGHIDLSRLKGIDYTKYVESTGYRKKFQKEFNLNCFGKVKDTECLHFINLKDDSLNFKVGNDD